LQRQNLTTNTNKSHFPIFGGQKGWGKEKQSWGKKCKTRKAIFWVLRQNRCRYRILECAIGKNAKATTGRKNSKPFNNFLSTFRQILSNFLD